MRFDFVHVQVQFRLKQIVAAPSESKEVCTVD